jgi:hypothetical protein
MALVIEATRRPDYFNPLVARGTEKVPGGLMGALLPGAQKCRELTNALTARAMLRVGQGKFDEAWQDLLACHRLGRLIARGATLIEALIGIAISHIASYADLAYLEHAPLTSGQILDRLKDLEGLPPLSPITDKIDVAERFMFLDSIQAMRRGGVGWLEGLAGGKMTKAKAQELENLERIDWAPALRNGNLWYDRLVAALRLKPRAEREKELDRIENDLKALKNKNTQLQWLIKLALSKDPPSQTVGKSISDVLITLLVPALHKVQSAYDRTEQTQRNLYLAFALAAYHADNKRYPAKLEELAPRYLPAVPDDLFSGKALIYRPSDKGYLLYSVGPNGKDDEGRSNEDNPKGDDVRVRMPLPEPKAKE